jgi:hypothetical protein
MHAAGVAVIWRIVALTLYVPAVAIVVLAFTYKPAYVVEGTALAGIAASQAPRAFPPGYTSLELIRGSLAVGPGCTARYPDGSIVTIVATDEASATIQSYGDALQAQWSSQTSFGGEVSRDLSLSDGRVARLIGEGPYLFAFFAPDQVRLSRLVAATPALLRNSERGWGNVLAMHALEAVGVTSLWFLINLAVIAVASWRLAVAAGAVAPHMDAPATGVG